MLDTLKPKLGSREKAKRVGRGLGSGNGKTAGRGYKGQRSRSGGKSGRRGFEGGQMPLQRRLPKRGFFNKFATQTAEVTTTNLNAFDDGADVTLEELKAKKLVARRMQRVRFILKGELTKKLHIKTGKVSGGAKKAIESKGGSVSTEQPN